MIEYKTKQQILKLLIMMSNFTFRHNAFKNYLLKMHEISSVSVKVIIIVAGRPYHGYDEKTDFAVMAPYVYIQILML